MNMAKNLEFNHSNQYGYQFDNISEINDFNYTYTNQIVDFLHNKTLLRVVTEGTLLSLISLSAVIGNSLVILSVYCNRKLRTITNCFVVSLASADLLVAILVLPLSIKVEITGKWGLGIILCDMWTSCDVMLCTASILNLCCISVDRFFAITNPLVYATRRSKRLALVMICVVWVVSIIITCPPIFGWQEAGRGEEDIFCHLTKDPGYIIYSALGSFYIPLLIMVFVYARIFHVTKKRNEMLRPFCTTFVFDKTKGFKRWRKDTTSSTRVKVASTCTLDSCVPNHGGNYTNVRTIVNPEYEKEYDSGDTDLEDQVGRDGCKDNQHKQFEAHPLRKLHSNSSTGSAASICDVSPSDGINKSPQPILKEPKMSRSGSVRKAVVQDNNRKNTRGMPAETAKDHSLDSPPSASMDTHQCTALETPQDERDYFLRRDEKRRERALLQRESKTAKTLAVVVGCFVVCWLPFFMMYITEPFCNCTFDPVMSMLFTWLGYCNSALNPLIYAFYNRDFRNSFWRLTLGHFVKREPVKI